MRGYRSIFIAVASLALIGVGASGVWAQLESGERGILPLDSSNTLEIGGISVDVGGKSADAARYAGWRIAQREGFKALWAKTHSRPPSEAPTLPDSTLDGLVSSIIVEREQVGPTRYVATLGILFDRARAGEMLGVAGQIRRSAPFLLIPLTVTGGTVTGVEVRNAWQRAWAEFRTSQSPIDYVRISGLGMDSLLINAAQTARPGRGWWRNIVDFYGAADVLEARVQVRRLYPGGPAIATFVGSFGVDRRPLGSFTLTAANSAAVPAMMREGVVQMDALFARWQAAGELQADRSLLLPEPPPLLEEKKDEKSAEVAMRTIQIVVTSPYSPVGWLRSIPGVTSVQEYGSAVLVVLFRGSQAELAAALRARGWQNDVAGGVFRITGYAAQAPNPPPSAPVLPQNSLPSPPLPLQKPALPAPGNPRPGGQGN